MSLIYEAASGVVTGVLTDMGTGLGIQPSTLGVFIYDRDTETAILGTAATPSSLSPVSTYVDASGNLIYYITPTNNALTNTGKDTETHTIRFTWTWTAQGATQTGKEELNFSVMNLNP